MSAATGVSASTAPAMQRRRRRENQRRTVGVQHADRGHALERLGHEDAPRAHAEDAGRERHDPQRRRRLVDGDEFAASDEPKKNAFQLFVPACTAAE